MKIGFIGLGIMGKPMAKNLLKAGHQLIVCDFNRASVEELEALGAGSAENGAGVAGVCDVIITMLPNSPHVRSVALGKGGIVETASTGTVLIDMSSIDPTQTKAIGGELAQKGIDMLDAPVSGGEPKAVDGTLSVMVGGKKETFERFYSLLMSMAGSVVYVGELGAGNVAKLANQIVVASNIAAVAEALTFARKAGVDPRKVYEAIRSGLAGSTVMDAKAPMMLEHDFRPGFRMELHSKDLNNALNAAHDVGAPVPVTAQMMEILQCLKADGCGKEDHAGMVKYYEKLGNITL